MTALLIIFGVILYFIVGMTIGLLFAYFIDDDEDLLIVAVLLWPLATFVCVLYLPVRLTRFIYRRLVE